MDQMEKLFQRCANDEYSDITSRMWAAVVWGAEHLKLLPVITGRESCGWEERQRLKQFLLDEGQAELYLAMEYSDSLGKPRQTTGEEEPTADEEHYETYHRLAKGQLLSFIRWCGERELHTILGQEDGMERLRLGYLALAVGYNKLMIQIASDMSEQSIQECGAVLERYGEKRLLLFRKWVLDFYRKQPEGKEKNRLAKRLSRYVPELLASSPQK